jgi:hypothetical protein
VLGKRKNWLTIGKSLLLHVFIRRVMKLIAVIINTLLSTLCRILSDIMLSRLTPYAGEIIEYHHHGFSCNRSTADQIFCICQILEKKCEYNVTAHQLFIESEKARREVICSILIGFLVPMNLVRLGKMCEWRWGSFSLSTLVSPANLHSTNFSTITFTYHLGLVQ